MELKWKKDLTDDSLEMLAKEALSQIDKNRYDLEKNAPAEKHSTADIGILL